MKRRKLLHSKAWDGVGIANHLSWTSPHGGYQVGTSWDTEQKRDRAGARREGPGLPAPPPGPGPPGRQADKGCSLQAQ